VPLAALRTDLNCPLYPNALSLPKCSPLTCKKAGYSAKDFVEALGLEADVYQAVARSCSEVESKEEDNQEDESLPSAQAEPKAPAPSILPEKAASQLPFANGVVSFHQGPFEKEIQQRVDEMGTGTKVAADYQRPLAQPRESPMLSVRLLESIGFPLADLRTQGGLECGPWCQAEGYGCRELKDRGGFSATQLFRDGELVIFSNNEVELRKIDTNYRFDTQSKRSEMTFSQY